MSLRGEKGVRMRLRPAVILVVTGQPPDTEGLLKLLPSFVALPRELRGERVSKSRKRGLDVSPSLPASPLSVPACPHQVPAFTLSLV